MPGTVLGMGVVDWRRGTPEPTYMELTLTNKQKERETGAFGTEGKGLWRREQQ